MTAVLPFLRWLSFPAYRRLTLAIILQVFTLLILLVALDRETWPTRAKGATLYVGPSGACGGMMPCYSIVQAAVDAADSGDIIKVATGVYADVHMRPRNDVTTTGVVTQVVYITKSVTIQGGYTTTNWATPFPVTQPTTLDAQGQGRVLYITGYISPTIQGLRITGGNAAGEVGGGLCVYGGYATLISNTVASNTAGYGGGLYLYQSAAALNGNAVTSNTATADGGGVYLEASTARLNNNLIAGNSASGGGGLYLYYGANTLSGNAVISNTAYDRGGGLSVVRSNSSLNNNTVISNAAINYGGGLYLFRSNAALGSNIVNSNTVNSKGGGLFLWYSDAALTNTIVTDNHANTGGSGLYIEASSPRLLHTTIARNTGGDDSGVYFSGAANSTVALTNTILVNQRVGITVTSGNTAILNGVLWYGNASANTGGAGTLIMTNAYTGNPAFAADGYHLTASSAAVDRGVGAGVMTDIDGEARPIGAAPDLGADECPGTSTAWTVMVYLNGDNDLDGWTSVLFNRLELAMANDPSLVIRVLWDRSGNGDTVLYQVQPDTRLYALADYIEGQTKWSQVELDMGDPNTLLSFIVSTIQGHPAEHYLLAIVNHGGGWSPELLSDQRNAERHAGGGSGFSWDVTNGQHYLSTKDMGYVFSQQPLTSHPIDVVFYDACLMGMLEEAYEIRNGASFLVASQYETWSSFPYQDYLIGIQNRTPAAQAAWMVDRYYASLSGYPRTMAAIDLQRAGAMGTALNNLAIQLAVGVPTYTTQVRGAFLAAQKLDYNYDLTISDTEGYVDLGDFAAKLMDELPGTGVANVAQDVLDILHGYGSPMILHEYHQSGYAGLNGPYVDLSSVAGLSIYLPLGEPDPDSAFYVNSQLALAQATYWDEVIFILLNRSYPPGGIDSPGGRGTQPHPLTPTQFIFLPIVIKGQ
jgi:hypothetical protein